MDNKKKHGIVLGATVIVVAIVIWWFATGIINKNSNSNSNKTSANKTTVTNTNNSNSNSNSSNKDTVITDKKEQNRNNSSTNSNENKTSVSKNETVNTSDDANVNDSYLTMTVIDESSLGAPLEKQEIVLVSNKKLLLCNYSNASGEQVLSNNQLYYVVDVITNSNDKMSLFLNESAYNLISIGSKLNITYKVYSNDAGLEFPVLVDAKAI